MNFFSKEQFRVNNPEEELARVREVASQQAEMAKQNGVETTPEQVAGEVIKQYATIPHTEILPEAYALKETETNAITLELSPEPHDQQIEYLIGVMQEKGIRNALHAVEKMNNPHLLDDFHRFLIQFIASHYPLPSLREKDELWKPLHMTLFEVSLPEASLEDKKRQLKELISGMEQFYAGMLSLLGDKQDLGWFSVEVANANGSEESVFYVSVPQARQELFEKQILAIFPSAQVREHKNDYNIFNDQGVSVAAYAKLTKHFLYPLKSYEDFDLDPLGAILNSFSKIDREGEGAAIQFVIGARRDSLMKESLRAIEKIRKGEKVSEALKEINQATSSAVLKELSHFFKSTEKIEKEKDEKAKRSQAIDQIALEQFTRKLKSPFISLNIRLVASAATQAEAEGILGDLEASFNQFENGHGNRLEWTRVVKDPLAKLLERFSLRRFSETEQLILNLEELTTCLHFPASQISKATPQLKQAKAGTAPAPLDIPPTGTLLGLNNHRGEESKVYMAPDDRLRHFYVIGQTGTGKTTLLKNMIIQDIRAGQGVCFIDPHGTDIIEVLAAVPRERFSDVIYFDPSYTARPMALNMLEYDRRYPEQKTFVVNELFSIFNKLFDMKTAGGPIFEQYFRNAALLALDDPEAETATLLDVGRILAEKSFRQLKLARATNPIIVQFWREVAEKAGGDAALQNVVPYITSKFDAFLTNDIMRPIIVQNRSSFNFRQIMDEKKIILVNLSKGRLGEINANLIGLILVGKILMAALSRVDTLANPPAGGLPPFYLYIDEFQNITTDATASILSEARKYKLSLNIAHQFIAQLEEKVRDAVFGNVGSIAAFRVGADDAEYLEQQFSPTFSKSDLMNLDNRQAYLRLLVNGRPAKPFNISTLPPMPSDTKIVEELKNLSYQKYGQDRAIIEAEIAKHYQKIG